MAPTTLTLITVPEAATALGMTEAAIRNLIAKRAIPVVRIGRAVKLRPSDLEAWIVANTTPAGGAL